MIFLAELSVHNGVSASIIYVDTDGVTSRPADVPANQYYMPRLKSSGSVERHLFSSGDGVSGGTTGGASQVGFGNLTVVNGRPYGGNELIDDWINLAFRTVTIKSLDSPDQPVSQAVTRLVAAIEQLVSTKAIDEYDLKLLDRLADLNQPLLIHTYAGTTVGAGLGAEGNTDLISQIKPKIWGTKNNAPAIAVNTFDLIYQVSDGPVKSIIAYDGGLAFTPAGDFASINAMVAAPIVAGQYCTCLALGLFRLGGAPDGGITADVVEGNTAADRTAAQIANRMMAWFAAMYPTLSASISPATVTALDVLNSSECGVMVTGSETALTAIMRVLNSVGGWLLPQNASASLFDLGRLDAPSGSAVATYDIEDNIGGSPERVETGDDGKGVPSYKVITKYDQLGVVQKSGDLHGAVTVSRAAYLGTEWRTATTTPLASLLTQYPKSPVITTETCLITQAAALAEANRLLSLHSVRRDVYRMKLPLADTDACTLGSVVSLTSRDGRMSLGSGKLFRVIGRIDEFSDMPTATLDLWG